MAPIASDKLGFRLLDPTYAFDMFDNVCKFLIEKFPEDFATWLLGEPTDLAILQPSELSLEPIRADAIILLQAKDLILHLEFQTRTKRNIPYRMLDYRVRGHRRFPNKKMRQVVIYLTQTSSDLAWQTTFELENTHHQFEVIRLWEQPPEAFLNVPGLLPFATLSQTDDKEAILRQVAERIRTLPPGEDRSNIATTTAILSALVLDKVVVQRILRSDIMQESSVYLDIKAEGHVEGREEGQKIALLKFLNRRFGNAFETEKSQIDRLSGNQVEQLYDAALDFSSLKELSAWLQNNPPLT